MSVGVCVALGALALASAALSAVTGVAGGVILLSGLLLVLPATAVVPIHGAVQLAAGSSRVVGFWKHIRWDVTLRLSLGLVPGSLLGVGLVVWLASVSPGVLKALIAIAILASLVFAPKKRAATRTEGASDDGALPARSISRRHTLLFASTGLVCGALGIVVGSTGPIITQVLLGTGVVKEEHVATKSAVQSIAHLLKLPLFGLAMSFDYGVYTVPLAVMILAVVAGTWLGKRLLAKLSPDRFVILARGLLFLVAIQILVAEAAHAFASH